MSSSNHEESLLGLPHAAGESIAGNGSGVVAPVIDGAAATCPATKFKRSLLEMVDTFDGTGLGTAGTTALSMSLAVACAMLTTLSATVQEAAVLVDVRSGMIPQWTVATTHTHTKFRVESLQLQDSKVLRTTLNTTLQINHLEPTGGGDVSMYGSVKFRVRHPATTGLELPIAAY